MPRYTFDRHGNRRLINYVDFNGVEHSLENCTIDGVHHTQPTEERKRLWEAYHEMVRRQPVVDNRGQSGVVPVKAVEQWNEIELLKLQQ